VTIYGDTGSVLSNNQQFPGQHRREPLIIAMALKKFAPTGMLTALNVG